MKKTNMNQKRTLLLSVMLFAFLFIASNLMTDKVQAAAKPSISKNMEIGTGSTYGADYFYDKEDYYMINVENPVKGATYSFTTSDKNVVTVKVKGTKAYITGVKAGSANITCQQKLKGKTTKIGTCKVTVKNAKVYAEDYEGLSLGKIEGTFVYYGYRNNDATYTFTSNSKNFTMKEAVTYKDAFGGYVVTQTINSKKPGTYKVTVKETYNKKTKTIGELEFTVKKAIVDEDQSIYVGEWNYGLYLVKYYRTDVNYFFDSEDDSIVEVYKEDGYVKLKGKSAGTTTINVYEDASAPDENKLIGSLKITVSIAELEEIDCYFGSDETYVGDDPIELSVSKYPEAAIESISVTSSDPSIAKVSEVDEYGYARITPVSKGTVEITVTCGELSKTATITVYADEDEMYGW